MYSLLLQQFYRNLGIVNSVLEFLGSGSNGKDRYISCRVSSTCPASQRYFIDNSFSFSCNGFVLSIFTLSILLVGFQSLLVHGFQASFLFSFNLILSQKPKLSFKACCTASQDTWLFVLERSWLMTLVNPFSLTFWFLSTCRFSSYGPFPKTKPPVSWSAVTTIRVSSGCCE